MKSAVCTPCELCSFDRRNEAERRFKKLRHHLAHDEDGLYQQLDLLSLEGDLCLCVRLRGGDWLEVELDPRTAETGIGWVTYHVANIADSATRCVIPETSPALWWGAEQYLSRAIRIFDTHRRRAIR